MYFTVTIQEQAAPANTRTVAGLTREQAAELHAMAMTMMASNARGLGRHPIHDDIAAMNPVKADNDGSM